MPGGFPGVVPAPEPARAVGEEPPGGGQGGVFVALALSWIAHGGAVRLRVLA